jgi:hypothetical protein
VQLTEGDDAMPRKQLDREPGCSSDDESLGRRIFETLGPTPRDALLALVEYGLEDHEIARYHKLSTELVTELRDQWGISR